MNSKNDELTLKPIAYLRSKSEHKFQLPPQPDPDTPIEGLVEFVPGHNYDVALRDLEGFSRIWLIWWFHKNDNWRPTTLPPRGRSGRKGTFATRSPYRPNPLAMSCVKLIAVEGHHLYIGAHDLVADTPILDVKPYLPKFDAFPHEESGWFGQMESELPKSDMYSISFSALAESVLSQPAMQDLRSQIELILRQDPHPHRTRRILKIDDEYRLSCGDWRVFYQLADKQILVSRVVLRA